MAVAHNLLRTGRCFLGCKDVDPLTEAQVTERGRARALVATAPPSGQHDVRSAERSGGGTPAVGFGDTAQTGRVTGLQPNSLTRLVARVVSWHPDYGEWGQR